MRPLEPSALGATLYVPATRTDLTAVLLDGRVADLRSAVLCLEDGILPEHTPAALFQLSRFLRDLARRGEGARPALFVRPRSPEMLAHVLRLPGADRLDGVVAPKCTAETLPAWLDALAGTRLRLMPTLETREAFDPIALRAFRVGVLNAGERVLLVRIGGNDLLQLLGVRRMSGRTAYEGPLGAAISQIVCTLAPWGVPLSAPVMDDFSDPDLLRREAEQDLGFGLVTKTAIHPRQVAVIQAVYGVAAGELNAAEAVAATDAPAVFAQNGALAEPATHRRWARGVLARAAAFGVRGRVEARPGIEPGCKDLQSSA